MRRLLGLEGLQTGSLNNCAPVATCTNTVGSYSCSCPSGYEGDGVTCTDINECTTGTHNCNQHATCTNTDGSFTCSCQSGFQGNGVDCEDVNECEAGTHSCSVNAICDNTIGGYSCTCTTGWTGSGKICTDIDECADSTHNCAATAACSNTQGGFDCTCNTGYSGDGVSCGDVNECLAGTDTCHSDAVCYNTLGSFTCQCEDGFRGDGINCQDVDECSEGTADCATPEACVNTIGSFQCTCETGDAVEGRACAARDTQQYLGCIDQELLQLSEVVIESGATPESCMEECASRGFSLAGLRDGGTCYCGNGIVDGLPTDATKCVLPCDSSIGDQCGSSADVTPTYMSVYDAQPAVALFDFDLNFASRDGTEHLVPKVEGETFATDDVHSVRKAVYVFGRNNGLQFATPDRAALSQYAVVMHIALDWTDHERPLLVFTPLREDPSPPAVVLKDGVLGLRTKDGTVVSGSTPVPTYKYIVIVVTRNHAGRVSIYLDEKLEVSHTDSDLSAVFSDGIVNLFDHPTGDAPHGVSGSLAHVAIYDHALLRRQISALDPLSAPEDSVKLPSLFPKGQYCLPMTSNVCPGARWRASYRMYDTADSGGRNFWEGAYPTGVYQNTDITQDFCCHTNDVVSEDRELPAGNYCVYRLGGSCPAGFPLTGFRLWDEFDGSVHMGIKGGLLPDGEYTIDTKQFFCCRDDGVNAPDGQQFPLAIPFMLFEYPSTGCAQFDKHVSTGGIVRWDDGGSLSQANGDLPRGEYNGTTTKIHYCHYEEALPAKLAIEGEVPVVYTNQDAVTLTGFFSVDGNQDVTFEITHDNEEIFTSGAEPAVTHASPRAPSADLTFTPSEATPGKATVSARLLYGDGLATPFTDFIVEVLSPLVSVAIVDQVSPVHAGTGTYTVDDFALFKAADDVEYTVVIANATSDEIIFSTDRNATVTSPGPMLASVAIEGNKLVFTPSDTVSGTATLSLYVLYADDVATVPLDFNIVVKEPLPPPPTISSREVTQAESVRDVGTEAVVLSGLLNATTTQDVTAIVTLSDDSIFTVGAEPRVTSAVTGTGLYDVTYTPSSNQPGSCQVSISLEYYQTISGQPSRTAPVSFTITTLPAPPTFTVATVPVVHAVPSSAADDSVVTISPFLVIDSRQSGLTVDVSVDNADLFASVPTVSIDDNGANPPTSATLQYTPGTGAGSATVTLTMSYPRQGVMVAMKPVTFQITLENQVPTFSVSATPVQGEAGSSAVTVANFASLSSNQWADAKFVVSTNRPDVFAADGAPSIDNGGTLKFAPAPKSFGDAIVTVFVQYGNGRSTAAQTVTVSIAPGPPTFTLQGSKIAPVQVDSGVVTWEDVVAIQTDRDISGITITPSDPAFFSTQPQAVFTGTRPSSAGVSYAPAKSKSGTVTLRVSIQFGTDRTTTTQDMSIEILPADIPSFKLGSTVAPVMAGSARVVLVDWMSISTTQDISSVSVEVNNPSIFEEQPTLTFTQARPQSATLSFKPHATTGGGATVTVALVYLGNTKTQTQSFAISVNPAPPPKITITDEESAITSIVGSGEERVTGLFAIETSQDIDGIVVTTSDSDVFSVAPAALYSGPRPTTADLTFTPSTQNYGQVTIQVVVTYLGGTASTDPITLTVTVEPPAPTFALKQDSITVSADATEVVVDNLFTIDTVQDVVWFVEVTPESLFSDGGEVPAVQAGSSQAQVASLSFTPSLFHSGSATVKVTLGYQGGLRQTAAQVFSITINSAPPAYSFDAQTVVLFHGFPSLTVPNFLHIAGESKQVVGATVTVTDPELFLGVPSFVQKDGSFDDASLRIVRHPDNSGTSTVNVALRYQLNNAEEVTQTQSFDVVVHPQPPVFAINPPPAHVGSGGKSAVYPDFIAINTTVDITEVEVVVSNAVLFTDGGEPDVLLNTDVNGSLPTGGNLTFTPTGLIEGSSTVSVRLRYGPGLITQTAEFELKVILPEDPPAPAPPEGNDGDSGCPSETPVRCSNGQCVAAASECPPPPCDAGEVPCADGTCAPSAAECSGGGQTACPATAPHSCYDGSCKQLVSQCPPVPACGANRHRCADGSCVPADAAATCPPVTVCELNPCADGTCRDECPPYNGCDPIEPVECSDGSCALDIDACPSTPTTQPASSDPVPTTSSDPNPPAQQQPSGDIVSKTTKADSTCTTINGDTKTIPVTSNNGQANLCELGVVSNPFRSGGSGEVCVSPASDSTVKQSTDTFTDPYQKVHTTLLVITFSDNLRPDAFTVTCPLATDTPLSGGDLCLGTVAASGATSCISGDVTLGNGTVTATMPPSTGPSDDGVAIVDKPVANVASPTNVDQGAEFSTESHDHFWWWILIALAIAMLLIVLAIIMWRKRQAALKEALAAQAAAEELKLLQETAPQALSTLAMNKAMGVTMHDSSPDAFSTQPRDRSNSTVPELKRKPSLTATGGASPGRRRTSVGPGRPASVAPMSRATVQNPSLNSKPGIPNAGAGAGQAGSGPRPATVGGSTPSGDLTRASSDFVPGLHAKPRMPTGAAAGAGAAATGRPVAVAVDAQYAERSTYVVPEMKTKAQMPKKKKKKKHVDYTGMLLD